MCCEPSSRIVQDRSLVYQMAVLRSTPACIDMGRAGAPAGVQEAIAISEGRASIE